MFRQLLLCSIGLVALGALCPAPTHCEEPKKSQEEDIRLLKLRDWEPRSMLKTKATQLKKAKYPVIDVHNHLGGGKDRLTPQRVQSYLAEMEAAGVRTVVNLDGGWD